MPSSIAPKMSSKEEKDKKEKQKTTPKVHPHYNLTTGKEKKKKEEIPYATTPLQEFVVSKSSPR